MNAPSIDPSPATPGSARTPMEICWQFAYSIDREKLGRLYEMSKQRQWDAARDIPWDEPIDPSRPLLDESTFDLSRLPFVARLSAPQREAFRAHVGAHQLSQFLHGEQGALMTAAALTHAVPHHEGKLYSATQTMDEARHVEAFSRYIKKLAMIYPMSPKLRAVIDTTLAADHWVKIAIGMNLVVEGLALAAFHNTRRATACPVLRPLLDGVLRDEARHVAFGHLYVTETVAEMHPDDREDLADFAFAAIDMVRQARRSADGTEDPDPGFMAVLDVVGIDPRDFARGVAEARAQGIVVEPPRDQVHAIRDLMLPALVRVGVVTARTRAKYERLGIHVHDDPAVLESFEERLTAAPS